MTKQCNNCTETKPLIEFHKGEGVGGRRGVCKSCTSVRSRQYLAANRDSIQAKKRAYRDMNRAPLAEKQRAYRAENVDKCRESVRRWEAENKERLIDMRRAYRNANHEQRVAGYHNWRARKIGAPGSHTANELKAIYEQQHGRCAYCDIDLNKAEKHVDHKHPLGCGGSNNAWNLQWVCGPCNRAKGVKTHAEFVSARGGVLVGKVADQVIPGAEGE